MSSVTKPIMLNETGEQIVQKLAEMTESNKSYEMLLNTKADKVDVSAPFNFKGDTTYASLPTSGNEINDTYYCSDKKCRYTWNGKGWYQSSMNEVDYTDELAKMESDLEAGISQLSSEIVDVDNDLLNTLDFTTTEKSNASNIGHLAQSIMNNGKTNSNTSCIRLATQDFTNKSGFLVLENHENYLIRVGKYNSNTIDSSTFIEFVTAQTEYSSGNLYFLEKGYYYGISLALKDLPTLTEENINTLKGDLYIYSSIENNNFIGSANDYDSLINAISQNKIVVLESDITVPSHILINSDIEILGNGYALNGDGVVSYLLGVENCCAKISNLKLLNGGTHNVWTKNANLTIEDCIIHYSTDSVVRITEESNVIMKKCDVGYSSSNDGISPTGTSKVYLYDCKSHDNYDEGVSSHNGSYTEVHGGEYYNNGYVIGTKNKGAESSFGGVHIGGGQMGIVEGVYSHDNCTYGISFINFQEDISGDIEKCFNNLIEDNGNSGIWVMGARNLTVANNTIIKNGGAIHLGKEPTISGEPVSGLVASKGYIIGNNVHGNTSNEIIIDNGADNGLTVI